MGYTPSDRMQNWREAFPGVFRVGDDAANAVAMAREALGSLGERGAAAIMEGQKSLADEKAKAEAAVDAYVPVGNVRQVLSGPAPVLVGAEALVDAALGRVGGGGKAAPPVAPPAKRTVPSRSAQIGGYVDDTTIVPGYEEDVTIVPAAQEGRQPLPDKSISSRGNRVVYDNNGAPIEVDAAGNPITSTAGRQQMTVNGRTYFADEGAARVPDSAPGYVSAFGQNVRRISPEAAGGQVLPDGTRIGTGNVSMMQVSPDSPKGQQLAAEELERSTRELLMRGQRARAQSYLDDPYAEARAKAGYEAQQKAAERAGAIAIEQAKQQAMAEREKAVLQKKYEMAAKPIVDEFAPKIALAESDPGLSEPDRAALIAEYRRQANAKLAAATQGIVTSGRWQPDDIATANASMAPVGPRQ